MSPTGEPFASKSTLDTPMGPKTIHRLDALKDLGDISKLPYSIKVLLESCLRNCDGMIVTEEHVRALAAYVCCLAAAAAAADHLG